MFVNRLLGGAEVAEGTVVTGGAQIARRCRYSIIHTWPVRVTILVSIPAAINKCKKLKWMPHSMNDT